MRGRARLAACRVSRSGAIPEPTVTVRMKEIAFALLTCVLSRERARVGLFACPDSLFTLIEENMNQTLSNGHPQPDTRIAVIHSAWHDDIVATARAAIRDESTRHGRAEHITVEIREYDVPGAFEIPLRAAVGNARPDARPDAIIACGFVVDGGIYRHEFVAAAVIDGLMRVQLDTGSVPQQCHTAAISRARNASAVLPVPIMKHRPRGGASLPAHAGWHAEDGDGGVDRCEAVDVRNQ